MNFFLHNTTRDLPKDAAMVVWVGGWAKEKLGVKDVQDRVISKFGVRLSLKTIRSVWSYLTEIKVAKEVTNDYLV